MLGIQLNYFTLQSGGGELLLENEVRRVSIPEITLRNAKSNWFKSILHPVLERNMFPSYSFSGDLCKVWNALD